MGEGGQEVSASGKFVQFQAWEPGLPSNTGNLHWDHWEDRKIQEQEKTALHPSQLPVPQLITFNFSKKKKIIRRDENTSI
jgi:hypothetical protein